MTSEPTLNDPHRGHRASTPPPDDLLFDDAAGGGESASLWSVVDDRLRGRWRRMLFVGLLLATLLAAGGYLSTSPTYQSTGAIHVAPRLPVTLTPIPETGQLEHFLSFVNTQVQLIQSRRVFEHALQDPELAGTDWGQAARALEELEEDLRVTSDRNSELIFVAFEARSAKIAQVVVNAVIGAYEDIYGRAGADEVAKTLQRLNDYQAQVKRDLRAARTEIAHLQTKYDGADIREGQSSLLGDVEAIDLWISTARTLLDEARSAGVYSMGDGLGPTYEEIASIDPKLAEYRRLRDDAETQFHFVSQRYRQDSPPHKRAADRLQTADELYRDQFVQSVGEWARSGTLMQLDVRRLATVLSPTQVQAQIDSMETRVSTLRAEAQQMVADLRQLDELEVNGARMQEDLDRALSRIQQLEIEEASVRGGRISVAMLGSRPLRVHSDGRRKRTAFGGVLGFCLSFGLFFLLGTIDRRAFGIRQVESAVAECGVTCLGVLPDLVSASSTRDGDEEPDEVAAHCMHHIRNQIEAQRGSDDDGCVIALSSPYQGDGKTSIVISLGWSYAIAGYRTIVVDADLVGRNLTRQTGTRRLPGLKECLQAGSFDVRSRVPSSERLDILPVGAVGGFGPERIRRVDLDAVMKDLRDQYEIVLVDTGPVLGSLESVPVCAAADASILVLRRGRSCGRLAECVRRLDAVGSRCLGIILNCAAARDCDRYTSETSIPAPDVDDTMPPDIDDTDQTGVNPLVAAVRGREAA